LEQYERVLGPNPEAAEDVRELGEKLKHAEEEKLCLSLQLQEAEEVGPMILELSSS
jgi:E3 ubiquitin-protein ligase BRE1